MRTTLAVVLSCLLAFPPAATSAGREPPAGTAHDPTLAAAPFGHVGDFARPVAGLYVGRQPTAGELAALRAQGVHTVIDLRAPVEDRGFDEAAEAARLGMAYVALPIAGKEDVNAANADALQALLGAHHDGVLLHCASGNRAGALLALGSARAGMPVEQALALGREAGMKSLEAVVAAQLESAAPPPATD